MSTHIDSLPDDCLLPIFDRVPLLDLQRIDQVCPRWASLLSSACARRRTLVLILGSGRQLDEMEFKIPFNQTFKVSFDGRRPYFDLSVAELEATLNTLSSLLPRSIVTSCPSKFAEILDFTEMARFHRARKSGQLVAYFTDRFSNVDKLVVVHPRCDEGEVNFLIELLGFWSVKILKLWIRTRDIDERYLSRQEHHPVRHLLESINQKSTTLRQLTLDIDGSYSRMSFPAESYSFISQLKVAKLYLGKYDRDNKIWDIVHRFDSTELRNIGLGNDSLPKGNSDSSLNPKFSFTTKVSQLYMHFDFESGEQLGELCWRFPSLTSLNMAWSAAISFTQLVSSLAYLKQLSHLKLDIDFENRPENPFALLTDDKIEGNGSKTLSLPQVKILKLIISTRSHLDFESLSPLVFPSVQVIILCAYPPEPCRICKSNADHPNDQMGDKCHRLLAHSLKTKFVANSPPVRLYSHVHDEADLFIDWTNQHVTIEQDDQLVQDNAS